MARSSAAPIMPRVSAVRGTARTTKSAHPSSACRSAGATTASACSTGRLVSRRITRTRMPSAAAMRARLAPIGPAPRMARFEPCSSRRPPWWTITAKRFHSPRSCNRTASWKLRASTSICPTMCSGIQIEWRPVELVNTTSLATNAGYNDSSIPADAEWIQRRRRAAPKCSGGRRQPTNASASATAAGRSATSSTDTTSSCGKRRCQSTSRSSGSDQRTSLRWKKATSFMAGHSRGERRICKECALASRRV